MPSDYSSQQQSGYSPSVQANMIARAQTSLSNPANISHADNPLNPSSRYYQEDQSKPKDLTPPYFQNNYYNPYNFSNPFKAQNPYYPLSTYKPLNQSTMESRQSQPGNASYANLLSSLGG